MSDQRVRMKDIAEAAGVSTVAVSKALAGYSGVSESMRTRIVALAKEMGYEPVAERRKRKRASFNIGILVPEGYLVSKEKFYSLLLQHLTEEAGRCSSNVTTEIIGPQMEKECSVPMVVREDNMDGLILLGSFRKEYLEMLFAKSRVPLVFLGFMPERGNADCVISDGFYAACQITGYLLNRGHRRIAFVGRILETPLNMEQYLGYVRAMTEHEIPIRQEWVVTGKYLETMKKTLTPPEEIPDAFVCGSDVTAGLLIEKLADWGMRCPEDVSVVTFGNPGVSPGQDMHLATYELDGKEMARKAVSTLLRRMNGEYCKKKVSIVTGQFREADSVKIIKDTGAAE